MQVINKKEYGTKIYINYGRDISSATSLSMVLEPEVGKSMTLTPTLETSNAWVDDEQYIANEFASYTTTENMFDPESVVNGYIGRWKIKGEAVVGSAKYPAKSKLLRVVE